MSRPVTIDRAQLLDLLDLLRELEAAAGLEPLGTVTRRAFLLQETIRLRERLEDTLADQGAG